MKRKSNCLKVTVSLMCTAFLFACSNDSESESVKNISSLIDIENLSTIGDQEIKNVVSKLVSYDDEDFYTDWENENPTYIQLNGTDASFEGSGAVIVSDRTITIKAGGVYVISGKLDDGQIVVEAEDKNTVKLVLNGVEINCSDSAPIYVKDAENTIMSLPEGTENVITDGTQYTFDDSSPDEPNAAIFSKDDLVINGTGKLVVHGNYNNGITGKDDLKITSGNIEVISADDGIVGRDIVAIKEGTINIKAGGDGIKSTNDTDAEKGSIALEGGTYKIVAANDGIQAESSLFITDGDYTISTGGGSPDTIASREGNRGGPGSNNPTTTTTETETISAKGLKASVEMAIDGGNFSIDSLDDGIHSNNSVTIAGGEMTISTGDDGVHGDSSILTKGGNITITKSYEGIESKVIAVSDGKIHITANDDGVNVGGGNDGSAMDMQQTSSEENMLYISGGYISVDSIGDGLDSNGSIQMTGGTVLVSGPTENMNGSLDYDGSFEMTGGFLIAAGSSGMAQATSLQSTQNSILMTYPETQLAGTILHLEDSEGKDITTYAPKKDYQSVFISSPKLTKDSTYTLYKDGTSTGTETDGLYTGGDDQKGTKVVDFKISESVTWLNESGVTTGRNAQPGPGGGQGPGLDGKQGRPEMGSDSGDRP